MTPIRRRGMTLVEMLVAMTATLVLMAAVAQVFGAFGSAVNDSRAVLETDSRMRTVAWKLRCDLAGATAQMLPPRSLDSGDGYLEIIEGPVRDRDEFVLVGAPAVGPADHDDVLLLTTRSVDAPFMGRAPSPAGSVASFESPIAEVAWFARPTPGSSSPATYTLYRRQLLVMGYVGTSPFFSAPGQDNSIPWAAYGSWADYFNAPSDVSVRRETNAFESRLFPNTLADLARREARFMHNADGVVTAARFPFRFVAHQTPSLSGTTELLPPTLEGLVFDSTSPRQGEDVVLTNVLAFDVRVFDPAVAVVPSPSGADALVPGDPGYTLPANAVASGAYVDLGHGVPTNPLTASSGVVPHFAGNGDPRSKLDSASDTGRCTYDTWPNHYEANGKNEDGDAVIDQGTDGMDNDGDGKIDEPPCDVNGNGVYTDVGDDQGERETRPPYPSALRGVEVRIRCYEPSSRQVRQVTVRHTFVPH